MDSLRGPVAKKKEGQDMLFSSQNNRKNVSFQLSKLSLVTNFVCPVRRFRLFSKARFVHKPMGSQLVVCDHLGSLQVVESRVTLFKYIKYMSSQVAHNFF